VYVGSYLYFRAPAFPFLNATPTCCSLKCRNRPLDPNHCTSYARLGDQPHYDMEEKTIKASKLKSEISKIPDDADVIFGADGDISFYRVKRRGPNLWQIQFNELWDVTSDHSLLQ
jgi:hypothetical protein